MIIPHFLFAIIRSSWTLSNLQKVNVSELYSRQRQSLRPFGEFFDTSQFKPPASIKAGNDN
jgi:hypothetical protein